MAEFLTTAGIVSEVEKIVQGAEERLILVSPYIKVNKTLLERLRDADARGVVTSLVYGKVDLEPEQRRQLGTLSKLSLYFSENLHAKCYFNETHMVVGSMNLYEFSERNNREMGLLLTYGNDRRAFNGAVAEVESIIRSAERLHLASPPPPTKKPTGRGEVQGGGDGAGMVGQVFGVLRALTGGKKQEDGHCIRCSTAIPFDPDKPLCRECYAEWARYGNPNYVEEVCHDCGRGWRTTIERPLCKACYYN